jgi:hypothetical protein
VENGRGLGRHLAQWLIARGEQVEDVPATATARVRESHANARSAPLINGTTRCRGPFRREPLP